MDPVVIYILLFTMAVSVCCGAFFAWRPPQRACQMCGKDTSLQQRRCIHCGYLTNH